MKTLAIIFLLVYVTILGYVTDREHKSQQEQIAYQHKEIMELQKRIADLENKQ